MTAFSLLTQRCGLSLAEAADFLGVRLDTVKSWSAGRNPTPDGVIDELRELYEKIEIAARNLLTIIEESGGGVKIELGYAADDKEARDLGWPCVGAQRAALGIATALSEKAIILVPRGSTPATAAAVNVHGR